MAGEIPAQANYGDKVKLEGFKQAGGNSGPMIQKNPVGRPAGSTTGVEIPVTPVVTPQPQTPEPEVPAEHVALMQDYGRARKAYEYWATKATAANAGPNAKLYAREAYSQMVEAANLVKQNTPDFV
jgi:hypothetical protein